MVLSSRFFHEYAIAQHERSFERQFRNNFVSNPINYPEYGTYFPPNQLFVLRTF